MKTLQHEPRPSGVKKLTGEDDLYRICEGDYRIIYTIQDKEPIVLALKIGGRKEIYR
jgi:mRNA interferase RelE/StbE